MKRCLRIVSVMLLLLMLGANALAQVTAEGTVVCGSSMTLFAEAGGTVSAVSAQVGSRVEAGEAIASLRPNRVYAPCAGTVEAIFAWPGQSAEAATERYGGALSIAPEYRYMIYASSEYAYESYRTMHISVGQTVYMRCTADGTHRGAGIITQIDDDIFYIEATGGTFYNGETVYVYMESDYESVDRLGKATVVAQTGQAVSAEGDVARLYVGVGDFVEKGQLLFETLAALPDGAGADDLAMTASASGYVTKVFVQANQAIEKGAPLLTLCPVSGLEVAAAVSEAEIRSVDEGESAEVCIELADETLRVTGQISAISYISDEDAEGNITYDVRVSLPEDERITPGMSATMICK